MAEKSSYATYLVEGLNNPKKTLIFSAETVFVCTR